MTKILQEVGAGFRSAAYIIGAFMLAGLLAVGMRSLLSGRNDQYARGILMIVAAAAILLLTARKWAKWFGPVCLVVALRFVFAAFLGRTLSVPSLPVPRLSFLAAAGVLMLGSFLTYRFVNRIPSRLDSLLSCRSRTWIRPFSI